MHVGEVGFDAGNWKIQLENIQRKKYELRWLLAGCWKTITPEFERHSNRNRD